MVINGQMPRWRAAGASWWEWTDGSSLFFWRWTSHTRPMALAGHPVWVEKPLPRYTRPQAREQDLEMKEKVAAKLTNVQDKRYVCHGKVHSLTSFFWVPKGSTDIRMVYDASKSA
jgi:hypothetical protein